MVTSEREIMEFIEEYDVKFIRLAFSICLATKKYIHHAPGAEAGICPWLEL